MAGWDTDATEEVHAKGLPKGATVQKEHRQEQDSSGRLPGPKAWETEDVTIWWCCPGKADPAPDISQAILL